MKKAAEPGATGPAVIVRGKNGSLHKVKHDGGMSPDGIEPTLVNGHCLRVQPYTNLDHHQ
jgi:hypothetical protein